MTGKLDRDRERFRSDPGDRRAFEALEEQLFLAGDWSGLVDLYRQRLSAPELAERPEPRAQLLLRMGQVFEERHQEPERAIECYRQALAIHTRFRPALQQLRRLHSRSGQWELALQIAEMESALPMGDEERAALLSETGLLWLERFDDPEQARQLFSRALEADPHHPVALRGWARALQTCGQTELAASAWQRLAEQLRGPERATALVALAELLGDPFDASGRTAELYRRALGDDPRNPEAIEAMAIQAVTKEQWPLLADLMERRFDAAVDPARRVEIALEAAEVERDRLSHPAAARVWLSRAAELGPENPMIFEALADLERELGDDEALLQQLERIASLRHASTRVSTRMELASLHSARGDDERARLHLQQALSRAPDDALVMEALSDTLMRLRRYPELVALLERRAGLAGTDPRTAGAVYAELGALHEKHLGDVRAARAAYERAFAALPESSGVAGSLERIYRAQEDWEALARFLEQAARSSPAEQRLRRLCELGDVLAEHLDRPAEAARAYEALLALDPRALGAHRGLQQLATASGDPQAVIRSFEREAEVTRDPTRLAHLVGVLIPMLEQAGRIDRALQWAQHWMDAAPRDAEAFQECARLHQASGHDAELVAVLEKLDPLLESSERAANRRRLAAHHTSRDRAEDAVRSYEAALEADPEDLEALEALTLQLEGLGRFDDLARARRRMAALLPPAARGRCLDALATLLLEKLDDVAGAIEVLRELAREELAPPDVDTRLEALLEGTERWDELLLSLDERQQRLALDTTPGAELALRRAGLLEKLGRAEAAITVYREIRASDPSSALACAGLERSLRSAGDAEALAAFLAEEAEDAPTERARERAALERSVLLEERLDQLDQARESYGELALAAGDAEVAEEAARRLERLLERTCAWPALREHLETQSAEGELEVERRVRLARLCRDQLADPQAAALHLEAATVRVPERGELWRELAALHDAAGRQPELAQALEAEIAAGADADREPALRARLGALYAGPLADGVRARTHYERLLELDPVHPAAAEFLIERWERDGRIPAVIRLLEARLQMIETSSLDPEPEREAQRLSVRLRIAGLLAGPLDDVDAAISTLEPLLGSVGPQPVVAEPLADLYQRAGYAEDHLELCRRASRDCQDRGEQAGWLLRLGETLRERGELGEAAEVYAQALDRRPEDREIQAALRDLYRRLGDSPALARLLEMELGQRSGVDEVALRLELAGLLEGLDRYADALEHLRRVLQVEPGRVEALDRALALLDAPGQDPPGQPALLLQLVDAALERSLEPSRRAALLTRRARALAGLPGRQEEAADSYRQALELEASPTLRRELRALLEALGRWDAVLDCLVEEASGAESEVRGALFERATEIAMQHFSEDAAVPWLQRLRSERPADASVLQRLARIHRRAQRWESLLQALDDELAICAHPPRRRDLQVEKAQLLEERFQSGARAAAALECARREAPRDRAVLRDLERLYRTSGQPHDRVSVLHALLEDGAADERVALHCELAALYTSELADPAQASAQLLHAVAATPEGSAMRTQLLSALGEALRSAGLPDAWSRCAEQELLALDAQAEVFRERRWELRCDLARVYESQLGRPDAAVRHLRALVDEPLPTSDPSARAAWDASQEALLRLLRVERSWVELERRLAARLERQPGRADRWLELARLRAERLYALPGAGEAYRRVLELEPRCLEALRGLRASAERLRNWNEVAASLDRELEHPDRVSAGERGALLRQLGNVCWRQLGTTTRASRAYAGALEANPRDFDSLHSLQRLLESMEDWRGALDLYESEIDVLEETDAERRQVVWLRVGELARERTGELERARRAYLRAAEALPLEVPQRRELAELHERCGDAEAFAEVFASYCDDAAGRASGADHVRLAETLENLGREGEALERVERALAVDGDLAAAWDVLARLREARGELQDAASALCAAAERLGDAEAAQRQLRAAELIEPEDPEGAATLLRSAIRRDPGSAPSRALLARVGARLGRPEEVIEEARRALDLRPALDDASRLELARLGGRAASERGRSEDAARFFSEALTLAPDDAEALAGYGVALDAAGDLEGARRALERRVALGDAYADRARHLAILGRALAAVGDLDAAVERYEQALGEEPRLEDAHSGLVRLHEQANRVDAGVAALERWAEAAAEPSARVEHLLRAAAWELREGGRADSAERHLRQVLEASPRNAHTWVALADLLWDQERPAAALEVATAGLVVVEAGGPRARLALIRGRALEQQGQRREASEAYAEASRGDPGCAEACLARARLLRGLGEWRAAATALEGFDGQISDPPPSELAEVLHQLARLRAGPLEDLDGALESYRRTLVLAPERRDVRVALTELLSHRPGEWKGALAQLRLLLDDDPTDPTALLMLQRVADNRGGERAMARARALLKALGIAPPRSDPDPGDASLPIAEPAQLEHRVGEALRRLASEAADEIAEALEASDRPPIGGGGDADGNFRSAVLAAEGRLTAPALLPLCDEELAEVLSLVAGICLDGDPLEGSGERLNALSNALGRRTRRKLRRLLEGVLLGEILAFDFGAWRQEVRALAAAVVVDETDIELRDALLALLRDGPAPPAEELSENADLSPRVAASAPARALVRLAVQACLREL